MTDPSPEVIPAVVQAHECQNGCGRLADVVIVTLSDSAVDIFCGVCHLMMMLAVAQQLPDSEPPETVAPDPAAL